VMENFDKENKNQSITTKQLTMEKTTKN